VDAHHDFLWRQVRRFGVPSGDVDDVVQQAFVVFAQRIGDIVPGSERAFLYAACRNAASNQRRVAGRRREAWDDAAVDAAIDPAASLDDVNRARSLVDRLLEGMDDDLRAVLVLYEVEEMTVPEIATLLDIPAGTAASRLRRAREDVAVRLQRHGLAKHGEVSK
jgi:RNA polymerase sigma-70 factor (ECF subfamily)